MPNIYHRLLVENTTLRYIIIGGWNTIFGYATFALMYLILKEYLNYMLIAIASHIIAVTQSFVTQRTIVFRSKNHCISEYIRFHITNIASLGLGLIILPILVETVRFTPLSAQALTTLFVAILSYHAHKHFTFKK